MKPTKAIAVLLLLLVAASTTLAQELLSPQEAFQPRARFIDAKTIEVRYEIAPGYYLYRDKFAFSADKKNQLGEALIPRGEVKQDEYFGRVETFRDEVVIRLSLSREKPGWAESMALSASSQGCADIGVCYPPTTQVLTVLPAPTGLK